MITDTQIQANQRNALKSTGPLNTENTRFNGVKHGILSSTIIIDNIEDRKEFDKFLEGLQEDLNAENTLQEVIIEKIAVDFWRMRRLLTFEKSKINDRLGYLSKMHRMYTDPEYELIIKETYTKTCNELEDAKKENNIKEVAVLETRKELLKNDLIRTDSLKSIDWEDECNSRLFPGLDSLELIVRYETSLERGLSRKLEILHKLKKMGSFRKK